MSTNSTNAPTNADKLFEALTKDFARVQSLQKVLKMTQMMPVMSIVTAVMGNKPAPKPQVSMLLRSIDDKQLGTFKTVLTDEQYTLLVAAMKDEEV